MNPVWSQPGKLRLNRDPAGQPHDNQALAEFDHRCLLSDQEKRILIARERSCIGQERSARFATLPFACLNYTDGYHLRKGKATVQYLS